MFQDRTPLRPIARLLLSFGYFPLLGVISTQEQVWYKERRPYGRHLATP
jgi:hypothetical protein